MNTMPVDMANRDAGNELTWSVIRLHMALAQHLCGFEAYRAAVLDAERARAVAVFGVAA